MLEKLRQRSANEEGFTLVELLVVMLILGILAAIAIPAFFSQRDKGYDSDAKSNAKTVQTALETYATDNGGSYVGASMATATGNLRTIEPTIINLDKTGAGGVVLSGLAANTYTITATSKTGTTFGIQRAATGTLTYPCSVAKGGCPSTTTGWGS